MIPQMCMNTLDTDSRHQGLSSRATYTRDAATGLDYADQRYYSSAPGRFLTPDPHRATTGSVNNPADPGSWNRYAYTRGDPINRFDPRGLADCGGGDLSGVCDMTAEGDNVGAAELEGYDENGAAIINPLPTGVTSANGTPDPQGGGTGTIINISNLSTSSGRAIQVQNELRWLKEAIAQDDKCSKWLAGSGQAIDYMLGNNPTGAMMVGVGSFSDATTNAVAGTNGTNLTPGSMLITVKVDGAFFNSNVSAGYGLPSWITGGSAAAQGEILLHELAHDVGASGFINGDLSPADQTKNHQMVMDNCGSVINLLR